MPADQPNFWLAIGEIIWINILLSGDNAVVIAMACRNLKGRIRMMGMVLGAAVAVGLRVLFTGAVTTLLAIPFLKIVGALALVYIAVDLVRPKSEAEDAAVYAHDTLVRAIATIVVADLVMSLDNVLAIAAVAQGNLMFLVLGLALSVPLIIFGSVLIGNILDRAPAVVWAGAGLLGWVAGEMFATDAVFGTPSRLEPYGYFAAAFGAAIVLGAGLWLNRRQKR